MLVWELIFHVLRSGDPLLKKVCMLQEDLHVSSVMVDTRNRPRLVESPDCVAGSVQDWIGRWKARFLWKEKL